jgi:hypothetical protein
MTNRYTMTPITKRDIANILFLYASRGYKTNLVETMRGGETVYDEAFELETKAGRRFRVTVQELN